MRRKTKGKSFTKRPAGKEKLSLPERNRWLRAVVAGFLSLKSSS
jgi:hypothetical protein